MNSLTLFLGVGVRGGGYKTRKSSVENFFQHTKH